MIISLGCDHIVTGIKISVSDYLKSKGHEVIDCGTYDYTRTHYPIYGKKVADCVVSKKADLGIVICGTGVGIANGANKVIGSRTVLARDITSVKYAKEVLNANILAMGGKIVGEHLMFSIIDTFIESKYNESNNDLLNKLASLEKNATNQIGDDTIFDSFIEKWDNGYYAD
jgi:galactose-6-phosphate isomerase